MPAGLEAASREDLLALIGLLREQIEALSAANAALTERVAELERKAGRNSGNSNMPPSTDVFGRSKEQAEADPGSGGKKTAARRGKQRGAKGRGLSLVAC